MRKVTGLHCIYGLVVFDCTVSLILAVTVIPITNVERSNETMTDGNIPSTVLYLRKKC